ncbi:hypothetical protein GCM10023108_55940 [Saccharopolyspora hordei]
MVLSRLLRAGEGKMLKRLRAIAAHINELEGDVAALSDAELRGKTDEFKRRYADGETLDELLPEAFAVAREGAKRTLGQRHYDVQLMGGAALHLGNIAEMKTGEGKTLTCVLPAYLNAITGKGVHVVTVNDYLARRDAEWMGRVHRFLGLEVGAILAEMTPDQRRKAYAADVTYGTNNEFGFDYLRDNMAWSLADCVQRGHNFAIVDEVDSILIDEARTPLIISGPADQSSRWYQEFARLAPMLERDKHYEVDERKRTVGVTEEGVAFIEDQLGIDNLYEAANTPWSATSTTRSRPRSSTSATRSTSSATARCSSSTSSPAASSPGAASTRACTRPSRPRKASRSRPRTRRWPRSRCRTTSASTTSSPA